MTLLSSVIITLSPNILVCPNIFDKSTPVVMIDDSKLVYHWNNLVQPTGDVRSVVFLAKSWLLYEKSIKSWKVLFYIQNVQQLSFQITN